MNDLNFNLHVLCPSIGVVVLGILAIGASPTGVVFLGDISSVEFDVEIEGIDSPLVFDILLVGVVLAGLLSLSFDLEEEESSFHRRNRLSFFLEAFVN